VAYESLGLVSDVTRREGVVHQARATPRRPAVKIYYVTIADVMGSGCTAGDVAIADVKIYSVAIEVGRGCMGRVTVLHGWELHEAVCSFST
jgi:hypothetical protein